MQGGRRGGDNVPQSHKERLHSFLRKMCKCDENGSNILRRQNAMIVTDLGAWPQSFSDALHSQFPSSTVLVTEAQSSTSGFQVHVSFGDPAFSLFNLVVLFCVFATMATLLALNVKYALHEYFVEPNPWPLSNRTGINDPRVTAPTGIPPRQTRDLR